MTALTGQAARGGAATLLVQLLRMVMQLGSIVILARLLEPAVFGLVAMVVAVIGIAELLRDFGLSIAAAQAPDVSVAERDNLFWANTALGVGSAALAAATTPLLVALYDEPLLAPIVLPLAVVFILSGMNAQYRADLARRLRFSSLALADLLGPAAGIGTAVVLAVQGAGVWALVAQQIVTSAVVLLINAINARWIPGRYDRSVSIRRFFRFGINVLGTHVLNYLTRNVDNVAVGALRGPDQLGLYSRAYQLVMVPLNQINAPLTNVAVPVLSRVSGTALDRALHRAQLVSCYVTAPLLVVAAALADPLVLLLMGPDWDGLVPIFAVLAIGGIFRSISQIAYWTFLSTGRTGPLFRLQLWTQPIMMVLIVAGAPWGGLGVAVGHLVANIGYWIVSLVVAGRETGVKVTQLFTTAATAVLAVAAPAGLAAWATTVLVADPWAQVGLGALAAALAALAVGALVPKVRRDMGVMADTVRQMARR
jgi:PST family polysaccharide transporter